MDLLLAKRKILITGGSKGIGLACAKTLADEGADLVISSRSRENLDIASGMIGKSVGELHLFPADLSVARDVEQLAEFVNDKFGYLDSLLLNSGGPPMGTALEHTDEDWLSAVNSVLMPVIRLTRNFVPVMQERGFGRILGISSTGIKQPIPGLVLSNSIRLAVAGFLKTLSSEVAGNNVLINSILPGSTNTERLASLHETIAKNKGKSTDEVISERKKNIPAGKFAEPENLASLAAYLLSAKNEYVTGQCIAVDGGQISFPL